MRDRLEHVDGLRGLAAMMVLWQHALQLMSEKLPYAMPLLDTVNLGRFGVILFFLISGFVIPFSFKGDAPLRGFALSRAFRLLPALWLSVAAMLAMDGLAPPGTVLANMVMLARPLGLHELHGGYWTLSFELGFYCLCAVAFAAGWLRQTRFVVRTMLAMMLFCLLASDEYHFNLVYFLMGLLVRLAMIEEDAEARFWLLPMALGLSVMSVALYWGPDAMAFCEPIAMMAGMILPLPLFYAVVRTRPKLPGWMLWLGAISYSLYLFHEVPLQLLRPVLEVAPLAYPLMVMAAGVVLAWASYRLVEVPFNTLGKRVAKHRLIRPAPTPAAG